MTRKKPVILCILDGWGKRQDGQKGCALTGTTPFLDDLMDQYPCSLLEASGLAVGLPKDQMGNSEVGHMNLGAGRIVMQDLPRIDETIENQTLHQLPPLQNFIHDLKKSKGTCHLIGILSDGGVHGHINHLIALLKILDTENIPIAIHGFLDGRDTPPKSALPFIKIIQDNIKDLPNVKIATLMGRYYGMDRDNRWDRTQKAYDAIIVGHAKSVESYTDEINASYAEDVTDEFMLPFKHKDYEGVNNQDGLISFNYRSDRIRQILRAFLMPDFHEFKRSTIIQWAASLAMVDYADDLKPFLPSLFYPIPLDQGLGELISSHGLRQFRIAETEKYAHVTFFFNGGIEEPFPGEERVLIPSPHIATYDVQPEMSIQGVTDKLIEAINSTKYDFILVNFANPDMIGHTGIIDAAKEAMIHVDQAIKQLVEAVQKVNGILAITADHGNIEYMYDPVTKQPHTAHTMNPVPFILVTSFKTSLLLRKNGKLCDVAPTLLSFLEIEQPEKMSGMSLLTH
ncbi:MAG: 2,3-bisphosphoglycerate-independent phosphoglycerate mutase [Alphaproteobacteria bacterium]|nr:2,3-bisphosphoglycerate-independent phosphoglycerate mutase [Alphaproteobacteria bacterium]